MMFAVSGLNWVGSVNPAGYPCSAGRKLAAAGLVWLTTVLAQDGSIRERALVNPDRDSPAPAGPSLPGCSTPEAELEGETSRLPIGAYVADGLSHPTSRNFACHAPAHGEHTMLRPAPLRQQRIVVDHDTQLPGVREPDERAPRDVGVALERPQRPDVEPEPGP